MNIRDYLKEHKILADGAFGTYYSELTGGAHRTSEKANIYDPDLVKKIHRAYLEAGAGMITTNTFAAHLQALDTDEETQCGIIRKGFLLASEAAAEFESREPVFVAADIGPIGTEEMGRQYDAMAEYKRIVNTFLDAGARIFLFETFPDARYVKALASYIKEETNDEAFVITNFCMNSYGYTRSGFHGTRLLQEVMECSAIDAVGFNCGVGSGHMYELLKKMNLEGNKYISVMPNSNYPQLYQDRMVYLDNQEYFTNKLKDIAGLGVHIVGGCCGTVPEYIRMAAEKIDLAEPGFALGERKAVKEDVVGAPRHNSFHEKLMNSAEKVIACELDPPYNADVARIMECSSVLKNEQIDLITFADSPMARGRVDSILMGVKVHHEVGTSVMPHIACRDKNAIGMRAGILGGYINDIRNLLIVTGDPIPGGDSRGVFDFNSIKLMDFVKELNREHFSEDPLFYGGALNYGRGNIDKIIERTRKKIAAGASYFLTQPIYTEEGMERVAKVRNALNTKILGGIMPLVSYRNAEFVKNEVTGIDIPAEVMERYHPDMTREEGEAAGVALAVELMKKMDAYVDGYYFMLPFNRVSMMREILKRYA